MKNLFKFKWLLLSFILSIASINTAWGAKTVTLYYAVPSSTVACQTVKCYYDCGYSQQVLVEMVKTNLTKDNKLIYSVTFIAEHDFIDRVYFQLFNGDDWASQKEAITSYVADASTYDGKMYYHDTEAWGGYYEDEPYTVYFVKPDSWESDIKAYAFSSSCDYNDDFPGEPMSVVSGKTFDGKPIYSIEFDRQWSTIIFTDKTTGTEQTGDITLGSGNINKIWTGSSWYESQYTDHVIKSGSTVIWDLGNETPVDNPWTNVYMYRMHYIASAEHDVFTKLSTNQAYKTYDADTYCSAFLFRNRNDETWPAYRQTTDITGSSCDIDGVALFTYNNTVSDKKLNWFLTTNAKKATEDVKVYFDNTAAGWSKIYLKYGTQWFTRATSAATKVSGTANLYYITIPNDVYYKEYFLSDAEGSVGYSDIETMTSISNRINYQESNLSSEITFIPSTGSGTPKVWTTSTIAGGHSRQVSITAPSHGTITVAYHDEDDVSQSETSGEFNVAQTCSLTVSSSAATGYKPATLTINETAHTSGSAYIIRENITVAATFSPKQSTITFDKEGGAGGADGTTGTYDADMTTVEIPHKIGYAFAGYYDGDDGTGNQYYKADGTSYQAWNKNTESTTTLYAKWVADNKTFTGVGSDKNWTTSGNWTGGVPSNDYSSVTINREVDLSTHVHIGQLSFGDGGKLNITSTGALEVAGTITNEDASKINVAASGALIFDNSAGTTVARVDLSLYSSRWQMIAIPVSYIDVKDAFEGSSAYTYVWKYGEGWERRGYYDGVSAFESVLIKGLTGATFSGALVSTNTRSFTASYDDSKESGNVTMYGNSWPAPIAVSGITFTNIAASTPHVFNGSSWDGVVSGEVIPALQGFAVVANSGGGSVTIPYSAVRAVESEDRNTALKAPKHRTSETSDHIAIYISGNEWKNRIRLFESEQFSDEIDDGYEAVYIEGEGLAGELYAQKSEKKMNVLATNDLEGTVVGFFPGQATNYTISFEGDGKGYYLNDIKEEEATLIEVGNTYEFTPDESTNSTRFVISKTPIKKTPTSVENLNDGVKARKQLIDGALYIIRDGRIYNAEGALVK